MSSSVNSEFHKGFYSFMEEVSIIFRVPLLLLLFFVIATLFSGFFSLGAVFKLVHPHIYRSTILITFRILLFICSSSCHSLQRVSDPSCCAWLPSWSVALSAGSSLPMLCDPMLWPHLLPFILSPCSLSRDPFLGRHQLSHIRGLSVVWSCQYLLAVRSGCHPDLLWYKMPSWYCLPCWISAMCWARSEISPGLSHVQPASVPPAPQLFPQDSKWCPMWHNWWSMLWNPFYSCTQKRGFCHSGSAHCLTK